MHEGCQALIIDIKWKKNSDTFTCKKTQSGWEFFTYIREGVANIFEIQSHFWYFHTYTIWEPYIVSTLGVSTKKYALEYDTIITRGGSFRILNIFFILYFLMKNNFY